ncbi:zf-TFIIB domain-containing protein [Clavibacter nebraskensis]|uniref:TFIIB-type zinc ribbon-containing protein n=1 Tax=Clavibacter nebraskensis TaxID=31963 RepID=UPI003F86238B
MKCPNDSATLVMSERAGVEIDYRPDCRGVWLDRGELDKILDRAVQEARPAPAAAAPAAPLGGYPDPGRDDRRRDDDRDPSHASRDDRSYGSPDERSYGSRDDRGRGSSVHPPTGGYGQRDGSGGKPRKKESWLSELFD